ncbi:MAG: hypothetical protein ABI345_05965 [Jatrophihabitans sp.]
MGRDGNTPGVGVEFFDADPSDAEVDEVLVVPEPRWPRWIPVLVAAGLVAAVITLVTRANNAPSAAPPTPTPSPSWVTQGPLPTDAPPSLQGPPITVTTVSAPLLGVQAGWELFGLGGRTVVRIEFASGRITSTTAPGLISAGAVSFVVGTHEAVVRPHDFVPGYRVPDGQPARQLAVMPSIGQSQPVFPGPDPDLVWAPPANAGPADIGLASLDDASSGPLLPVPAGVAVQDASPDGAGYLLFHGPGGIYDARPSGLRRITTGRVLAVGSTHWLVDECGGQGDGCTTVVIDQASRTRRVLDTRLAAADVLAGVISPDGSTAALATGSGPPLVELVDLNTGAVRSLPLRIDLSAFDPSESLAWSPDSRWLFVTNGDGHLFAVDAHDDRITDLTAATGTPLPALTQIAVRSAP